MFALVSDWGVMASPATTRAANPTASSAASFRRRGRGFWRSVDRLEHPLQGPAVDPAAVAANATPAPAFVVSARGHVEMIGALAPSASLTWNVVDVGRVVMMVVVVAVVSSSSRMGPGASGVIDRL